MRAATMVAAELVMNQAQTRRGCSARRYQVAVNIETDYQLHCGILRAKADAHSGILAASNKPRRNLVTKREALPFAAAMQAAAVPQQKTLTVMRIRGLTRTIK